MLVCQTCSLTPAAAQQTAISVKYEIGGTSSYWAGTRLGAIERPFGREWRLFGRSVAFELWGEGTVVNEVAAGFAGIVAVPVADNLSFDVGALLRMSVDGKPAVRWVAGFSWRG
jgi:hypothetical protein